MSCLTFDLFVTVQNKRNTVFLRIQACLFPTIASTGLKEGCHLLTHNGFHVFYNSNPITMFPCAPFSDIQALGHEFPNLYFSAIVTFLPQRKWAACFFFFLSTRPHWHSRFSTTYYGGCLNTPVYLGFYWS